MADGRVRSWLDSDMGLSFLVSPVAVLSCVVIVLVAVAALLAPVIAPQNPFDLRQIFVEKAEIPPIWLQDGEWPFLLGTDTQGRDVLSAILYGTRISLLIGVAAVAASLSIGVAAGLAAGFLRGWVDNLLMRIADTVRASTMMERRREYAQAARIIGCRRRGSCGGTSCRTR